MKVLSRRPVRWAVLLAVPWFGGCAVTGHQIVQKRQLVPAGATQAVVVDCPAGKKVLGGGFSTETPDDIKLFASEPGDGSGNQSETQWSVMVKNVGASARQTTSIAICAATG